ncbi:MAG: lipoate--protein ligase family protein [Pirellulales bacterium]|nr:lipoate--protein ligase family protein [Pirellulales bacterium]
MSHQSLRVLDLTRPTPEENLALDEALLNEAESAADKVDPQKESRASDHELLRLWSPTSLAVILGRHSKVQEEVNLDYCQRQGIPILRRMSGGATVLIGPGCLMYSVLLSYDARPDLRELSVAHDFVLGRLASVISGATTCGTSDLVIGNRKFSGNALRCRRNYLLYHGTLLYEFPLEKIESALRMPPRAPDYRNGRSHKEFLANLSATQAEIRQALIAAFDADKIQESWPVHHVAKLVAERYAKRDWTYAR